MMRENTEKLERHEARERQLGEQLKKTITILTKRVSAVDGLKLQLNKLDERISGIEHLFAQVIIYLIKQAKILFFEVLIMFFPAQKDERERIQMQKTMDSLEDLESRLESWLTDIENKVAEINSRSEATSNNNFTDILSKLNTIENNSMEGIARLKEAVHSNVAKMDRESMTLMEKAHTIFLEVE